MAKLERVFELVKRREALLTDLKAVDDELHLLVPDDETQGGNGGAPTSTAQRAVDFVVSRGKRTTFRQIAEALGIENASSLRATLYRLVREERLSSPERATYAPPETE